MPRVCGYPILCRLPAQHPARRAPQLPQVAYLSLPRLRQPDNPRFRQRPARRRVRLCRAQLAGARADLCELAKISQVPIRRLTTTLATIPPSAFENFIQNGARHEYLAFHGCTLTLCLPCDRRGRDADCDLGPVRTANASVDKVRQIALDAYGYGYSPVTTDVTRLQMSNVAKPEQLRAPDQQLRRA